MWEEVDIISVEQLSHCHNHDKVTFMESDESTLKKKARPYVFI